MKNKEKVYGVDGLKLMVILVLDIYDKFTES